MKYNFSLIKMAKNKPENRRKFQSELRDVEMVFLRQRGGFVIWYTFSGGHCVNLSQKPETLAYFLIQESQPKKL